MDNVSNFLRPTAAFRRGLSNTPQHGCLDGLATELKVLILQYVPDIPTLRTLVRSSPLYHKAYVGQRQRILSTVLLRDMGPEVLTDALAVDEAYAIQFDGRRKQNVESFISHYKSQRCSPLFASHRPIELDTLASLASLQSVIFDLTSDFCDSTLSVVEERSHDFLSPNERRRIYRAFYRFELFRALFHEPLTALIPAESRGCFDSMDRNLLFLSIFKSWEVEELACVRDYMIMRHMGLFRQCTPELSNRCPLDLPNIGPAKELLLDGCWQELRTEYFMSMGLTFLRGLIGAPSALEKAYILERHLWSRCSFLTDALQEEPYDSIYPTDANHAYHNEEQLRFAGDSVVDSPNAAWPWSTHYKVEVWYFQREKRNLRKWAYVMWDLDRLDRWEVLEMRVEDVCNAANAAHP